MTNPTAWFCPSCNKHHAPHVETCPGGGVGPYITTVKPWTTISLPMQTCGCTSEKCRRDGCQARMTVSGASYVHDPRVQVSNTVGLS